MGIEDEVERVVEANGEEEGIVEVEEEAVEVDGG